jgi:ubiquinone/menaquinone biosynthesis C-methylase UbiE
MSTVASYILGHENPELERLLIQAKLIEKVSRRLLRECGIGPGMRVLEIGCGLGDMSMLLAEAVGDTGSVVAFDREEHPVMLARRRARSAGFENIDFVVTTDDALPSHPPFDAVVGRYVLMHQPNPTAMVRRAAEAAKHGGIVAFHEIALHVDARSLPPVILFDRVSACVGSVFALLLPHHDIGERLVGCFEDAGLPNPELIWESIAGVADSPIMPWAAETYRAMLPHIERLGIEHGDIGDPDTLAQRLKEEVAAAKAQVVTKPQTCAWARRP